MRTLISFLLALMSIVEIVHADSLPQLGEFSLLSDANVLRMKPPFETRYYFTFQFGSRQSATVIFDIYYDKNKYNESKNRVIIDRGDEDQYVVPHSEYPKLRQRLPRSLILAEKASIGISLQDCVASYARLLSYLGKR